MPDDKVIELHGNTRYAKCLDCGERVELADIRAHFETHGDPPDCASCGGIVKTATISFGQADAGARNGARRERRPWTAICSWCWVRRWWSIRRPGFPLLAKRSGARLVILNREATEQDEIADLVMRIGEIGA